MWLPRKWIVSRMQDTKFHLSSTKCPVFVANAFMALDVHTSVVRAIELALHNCADKMAFPSLKAFQIKVLTYMVDGTWYGLVPKS